MTSAAAYKLFKVNVVLYFFLRATRGLHNNWNKETRVASLFRVETRDVTFFCLVTVSCVNVKYIFAVEFFHSS